MCTETLRTKYGNARLNKKGYYTITSRKEGNNQKKLHRLIYEDYHKVTLLSWADIHHIDGDKKNNDISNLELLSHGEHSRQHMIGDRNPMKSEKSRLKLSNFRKGKQLSQESMYKKVRTFSSRHNPLGVFRVSKIRCPECKYNFRFRYTYKKNKNVITISSVDLLKLKEKVIANGFDWIIVDEDKACVTAESVGLTLEDLL